MRLSSCGGGANYGPRGGVSTCSIPAMASGRGFLFLAGLLDALEQLDSARPHQPKQAGADDQAAEMRRVGDAVVRVRAEIVKLQQDPATDHPIGAHADDHA